MRSSGSETLDPLIRLEQIVTELRAAAARNDLEVVCAAGRLLSPTMEQCAHLRDANGARAGEAADVAMRVHGMLAESQAILSVSLQSVVSEMKRIQLGKRAIALARRKGSAQAPGLGPGASA